LERLKKCNEVAHTRVCFTIQLEAEKMKFKTLIVAAVLGLCSISAKASDIPYPNVGTIAPTNTFTASSTGNITGYFVQGGAASGGGAGDLDFVGMEDVTTATFSGYLFNNQTTTAGTSANFGNVNAGDTLVFFLDNTTIAKVLSSNPLLSADGLNHAYSTTWGGGTLNGANIPAGTYVGMEDLPPGYQFADFNYNDDSFVFTNVSAITATPEPSSILFLSSGLLGLVGFGRRKLIR
jgi:hypothetical protein